MKEKAAQRLREGVMPMLAALYKIAHDESQPPAVRLAAVRDWLDRSGIKEAISVEVTVQPWEHIIDGIVSEVDDDQVSRVARLLSPDIIDAEIIDTGEGELADLFPVATPTAQPRIPSRRKRGSR